MAEDKQSRRALLVCLIAGFMTVLDVSIVNVALPALQRGLHAGSGELSWVVSGYTLTLGLALVPAGKLGDSCGRKGLFLLGLGLFTLVSVGCAAAPDAAWLVTARLGQGAAGGLLGPQVIGMIQQLFRGAARGRAFGLYGASVAVSTAVGPTAGGLLVQAAGWRWVFLVNLPIGLLALGLGARLLPRVPARASSLGGGLDFVGVLLLGGGVACVLLPMIETGRPAGTVPWWLLGLAAALLVGFVGWEVRWRRAGREPLVDLGLLRTRCYGLGGALGLVYFAGCTGLLLVLTLCLQQGLGYSALGAGATGLPFALGSAASSALGGRAVHRYGRAMVVAGLGSVALGLAVTASILCARPGAGVWRVILVPLLVAGLGNGLVVGPNQTLALTEVPPGRSGGAAAVLQTGQRVGTSLGTAVAATVFFHRLAASRGDYPSAAGAALYGATALVGTALLIGLADLHAPRRRRNAELSPESAASAPCRSTDRA